MIKKILTNRWVMIAFGITLLAVLIWFLGPLFGFGDSRPLESRLARLLCILFVLLLWVFYELYKYILVRKANKRLMDGITSQAPDHSDVHAAEEIKLLRNRIELAMATLKKSGAKGKKWGSEYLYQIPWYMFIGAPGSGKTTALINCGLRFPVSAEGDVRAVKGIGGTRNCDWWFSDDAIFLDTAGRYTTQESDKKADSTAWLGFLDLLKKFRSRRPLNGAIVTVSLSDLLAQSERDRDAYAVAVRQRIQELYQKLGVRFPVYLMVTKTDLLAGFMEFFSDLGHEERAQVFGMTFPYKQTMTGNYDYSLAFKTQFEEVAKRLTARLVDRMQQEKDFQRRALVYSFPQQFGAMEPLLARFIEQVFSGTRYEQMPLLRGVYFTSGTQEGTPIDRVLGALSRMLKMERKILPPVGSSGKSFFLTRLLKEVVFPEFGLAGFDEKKEKKRKWLLRGAYASLGVVAICLLVAWTFSYFRNEALINEVEGKVNSLVQMSTSLPPPSANDLHAALPFLTELRNLPYGYADSNKSAGWSLRFGLFQGERIGDMAGDAYQRALRTAFLPRIAMFLEEQIRNSQKNEVKYEALKAYLMLFDEKHLDPKALAAFLAVDLEQSLWGAGQESIQVEFVNHLVASIESRPLNIAWVQDDSLVAAARRSLASSSLVDRIYSRIRLMGAPQSIQPVKLSEILGPDGAQLFERASGEPLSAPFPAIFTYAGYHDGFRKEAEKIVSQMADEDKWVLGEQSSSKKEVDKGQLLEAVKRRYFDEYVRNWDALLNDIRLKKSASLNDTVMYARALSAPDSPLKKLLLGVMKEVSLVPSDATAGAKEKIMGGVLDGAKEMAAKILSGAPSAVKDQLKAKKHPESAVDDHFDSLRQLVSVPAPGQRMAIDQPLAVLNDFYQEISAYQSGGQGSLADMKPLVSSARLKAEAERLPMPLNQILKSLVTVTAGQAAAMNQGNIQKAIVGASSFCDKSISGRYPATHSSQNDILVADFNSVFSPGGELDSFFNSSLKQYVDTSGQLWKLKLGAESTSPISSAALRQFQNADSIRRTFFRGSTTASISAELRLVSTEWPQVTLEYNGESHRFSSSNSAPLLLRWPAQNGASSAKLYAANSTHGIAADGDWAIFRLIDKASSDSSSPERLRLVFMVEGKKAQFELRSNSVLNPFKLKELGAIAG
ncbi:MAG: type VI secretion system protein ImpL [Gallionellaceae bacterium]|nr:MAG: type VI secretion system protein ImpL [Gallionellaceae bacterium]